MKLLNKSVLFGFFAIIAFTVTISSVKADVNDTIRKSYDVRPRGWLKINSECGSIEVISSENDKVEIEVIRNVKAFSDNEAQKILDDFEINFRQNGNDIIIEAKLAKKLSTFWDRITNRLKIKFIVRVPKKFNVDLYTSGGSISVDDLDGEVKSNTSGGSLRFGNIKGQVNGKTSGGSIELIGCEGNAEIRTSGGSINVKEVNGTINASTSGGSITARIPQQPTGNCSLKTSGGSVNVYLAKGISANIDAKTSGGSVSTEFPVTVQGELSKTSLVASINGGGPVLYLRTSGGNIVIKKL